MALSVEHCGLARPSVTSIWTGFEELSTSQQELAREHERHWRWAPWSVTQCLLGNPGLSYSGMDSWIRRFPQVLGHCLLPADSFSSAMLFFLNKYLSTCKSSDSKQCHLVAKPMVLLPKSGNTLHLWASHPHLILEKRHE